MRSFGVGRPRIREKKSRRTDRLGRTSYYHPCFEPDADADTFLTVPDARMILLGDEYVTIELSGLHSYPADPVYGGTYTLHTLDRLAFEIEAETGKLLSTANRRGDKVSFFDDKIESGVKTVSVRSRSIFWRPGKSKGQEKATQRSSPRAAPPRIMTLQVGS